MGSLRDYFVVQEFMRESYDILIIDSTGELFMPAINRFFPKSIALDFVKKHYAKLKHSLGPLGYAAAKAGYTFERFSEIAIPKGCSLPPLPPQSPHKILACMTSPHLEKLIHNILSLWKNDTTFWQTTGTQQTPAKPSKPLVVMLDQEMPEMNLPVQTIKIGGEDLTKWLYSKKQVEELLAGLSKSTRQELKTIQYEHSEDKEQADRLSSQLIAPETYANLHQSATEAVQYGQRLVCALQMKALESIEEDIMLRTPPAYDRVIIAAPADLWYFTTTLKPSAYNPAGRGNKIPVLTPHFQKWGETMSAIMQLIKNDVQTALKTRRHKQQQ
ncbi:MAG: hypothetical protein Q7K43_01715 [Candidatus Woesearchaeota archaeon]|nr:hypothetical protein [Candidatus Woesearchaeota archaeon]